MCHLGVGVLALVRILLSIILCSLLFSNTLVTLPDVGVERCVKLDGLTEAQINNKLEELGKA